MSPHLWRHFIDQATRSSVCPAGGSLVELYERMNNEPMKNKLEQSGIWSNLGAINIYIYSSRGFQQGRLHIKWPSTPIRSTFQIWQIYSLTYLQRACNMSERGGARIGTRYMYMCLRKFIWPPCQQWDGKSSSKLTCKEVRSHNIRIVVIYAKLPIWLSSFDLFAYEC